MKKHAKILSFTLALILAVSTFVACDDGEERESESPSSSETVSEKITVETEILPDVAKNDYGKTFHMVIQPNSNRMNYYWVEESANDALSESLYARQQDVYSYLGVDIVATEGLGHEEYGTPFMTAVKNKDGSIDTLLSHAYMFLATFVQGGYLTDFLTIDGIDLDADYWSVEVMEEVAAGDHLYLGYSDFRLAHTYAITYNKEMLERYSGALNESIYDTVKNYHWTLDRMISLANLVYTDATADGKTEDDVFGIAGIQWVPFVNLLQASNIQLVDINEQGGYEVSVYNDKNKDRTATLVEKLSALSKSDCAWFRFRIDPTPIIRIYSNRTLLAPEAIVDLPNYLNYGVDFGIVPYPMFDEAQASVGYRSLDWGGWLCVPSYVDDLPMVADTLEMLSYYSDEVTVTFYEKLLGKQVADAPDDRAMLDIIWDSICSDIGLTYSHISGSLNNNLYMLPTVTQANATEQLASYVKSYETTANKQLKKFFASIK